MAEAVSITKSPNDSKQYRLISLENGLKAILISDPPLVGNSPAVSSDQLLADNMIDWLPDNNIGDANELSESDDSSDESMSTESDDSDMDSSESESLSVSDDGRRGSPGSKEGSANKMSAAALCVGVGSFSDPADIPGLAHFLEHMVFMGSEKYPNENSFDSYLGKHGGSSDAYTEFEQTIFYFDVERKYFEGALDRFAQFFIHPLMKQDAVDRETEAVDSEFEVGLPDDKNRIDQLLGNIAKKSHPVSKFMWGNTLTLKVQPKLDGIDIYERLQDFWKQHYVAQNMTLAVQSRDSLDQLEARVRNIFSTIPFTSEPKPSFSQLNSPYDMTTFNKIYKVIPVQNMHEVLLTWALPSQHPHYRVKPLVYLGWLLGHEGNGSIDSYLKKRHWAFELEAGCEDSGLGCNSSFSLFQIDIRLSDDGFHHLFEVVSTVFEYLAMLRQCGPQKNIFSEIKTIADNQFTWIEQEEPQDYAQELSLSMQLYKPEDYLTGDTLLMEYDEQIIRDCTEALTPDKVNLMILSNRYEDQEICDQQCPWFKTQYGVEDIPSEWLEKWRAPETNSELHLPAPNIYIATDFTIKEEDVPNSDFPVVISESPFSKVWYKKDNIFKTPRAFVCIYIKSKCLNQSAKSMCMTDVLVKLVENSLTEVTYDASQADFSCSTKTYLSGIVIKIGGFNQKILQLFEVIFDHIVNLKFTDKQFEMAKDEWKTLYHNHSIKPSGLNKDLRLSLLVHNHWTMVERLAMLSSVTHENLLDFMKNLRSALTVEMLVQGNYTSQEAIELEKSLLQKFSIRNHLSLDTFQDEIVVTELPENTIYYRADNLNESDDNCVITNYYQHGQANIREQQLMDLLLTHMDEPCFDTLRTNKQLGYVVYCTMRETNGILGYSITIASQSNKFSMKRLDEEIENFLRQFRNRVMKMKEDRFQRLVKSLIAVKLCEDTNLQEEVERNWYEILDGTYIFNRRQREVEELRNLTLDEYKIWASNHLLPGVNRRKFGVQVIGSTLVKPPKKTSSAPSAIKRAGSNQDTSKKAQRPTAENRLKKKLQEKQRNEDVLKLSSKSEDAHGNLYVKDISSFKTACKKYPVSQII